MYDELVKRLRSDGKALFSAGWVKTSDLAREAADAIEQLTAYVALYKDGGETAMAVVNDYKARIEELTAINERQLLEIAVLSKPRWIPVAERLPKGADKSGKLCENVWLFFDDGNVYPGWMNGITEKVYYLDNYSGSLMTAPISRVKMWQPRPQQPKEET